MARRGKIAGVLGLGLCLAWAGVGCPSSGTPDPTLPMEPEPMEPEPEEPEPEGPVAKTAAIRLLTAGTAFAEGTVVEVAEDLAPVGVSQVEWDFSFDGTNFNVEQSIATPTQPGPPVQVYLGAPGTQTIALRATYDADLAEPTSPIATLALTVLPPANPSEFRPVSRDLGELDFIETVYQSAYSNLQAHGGQSLAVNGGQLLAGWWAIAAGQAGYYLTGSADGGITWSAPQLVSTNPVDRPGILREPQLSLAPLGPGFFAVWVPVPEAELCAAGVSLGVDPTTLTVHPIQTLPKPASRTLAIAPWQLPREGSTDTAWIFYGTQESNQARLAIQEVAWTGALPALAAQGSTLAETGIPTRIRGGWPGATALLAIETRAVQLGGGTSGGGQSSVTLKLQLVTLGTGTHPTVRQTVLEDSAEPQRLVPFGSALGVSGSRFQLAWFEKPAPPFTPGGVNLVGGSFAASGTAIDAFYPSPSTRLDIGNLALAGTPEEFVLLYTLPRLDVDPAINTNRSEELYAARWPLMQGAALAVDLPVNRDDPDGNEGLETPSIVVDSDGTVHAGWAATDFNKKRLGRFGWNRMR